MDEVKNYEEEVFKSSGVILVDFTATWCGPCKALKPVLEGLEGEFPAVKFYKLDVDANQDICTRVGIRSVPTVIVYDNGEAIETLVGAKPKKYYQILLESLAKPVP